MLCAAANHSQSDQVIEGCNCLILTGSLASPESLRFFCPGLLYLQYPIRGRPKACWAAAICIFGRINHAPIWLACFVGPTLGYTPNHNICGSYSHNCRDQIPLLSHTSSHPLVAETLVLWVYPRQCRNRRASHRIRRRVQLIGGSDKKSTFFHATVSTEKSL